VTPTVLGLPADNKELDGSAGLYVGARFKEENTDGIKDRSEVGNLAGESDRCKTGEGTRKHKRDSTIGKSTIGRCMGSQKDLYQGRKIRTTVAIKVGQVKGRDRNQG